MDNLYFKSQNGDIVILSDEDEATMYFIRKEDLALKIDGQLSDWVMQLMQKTWMDIATLYRLAQFIKTEHPDNSINWYNTFFIVEKAAYLEQASEILLPKKKSLTDAFFDKITFNREQSTEETHKMIDEIVRKRLQDFGLLPH